MNTFYSIHGFEEYIKAQIVKAQEDAIHVMLLKLDEFIKEDVYNTVATDNENAGSEYVRTYQVYEMFDSIKSYIKGNTVYGGIGVAGAKGFKDVNLIHRKSTWTHDTRMDGFEAPNAIDMVTIIEEGLSYGNSIFGTIKKRPFWSNFKKWCIENYNDIFLDCCIKNNIHIKR